ncbi:hypothetical protein ACFWHT_11590 [Microbacterium sp. NPDC058342]|uniref:hypothetical protein n=1 Tax=Microbacterium sp. NPDC058342 TaxID=3346454 RepID=UPI00366A2596
MKAIITSTARSLWRHWPALLAWYLGGLLVHVLVIEAAGFVGAYSATLGFLILPIAILARLVSMVAMFLVLRDGLAELGIVAPLPEEPQERRRSFTSALLASILPFVAVYWAQGMLRDDVDAYLARSLQETSNRIWTSFGAGPVDTSGTGNDIPVDVWTITIIVVAFSARWAWGRWSAKASAWLSPLAVYFEVVWVFFSVIVIGAITDRVQGWIDTRAAVELFDRIRLDVLDAVAPLAWLWDGTTWLIGQAGPILLAPLAWLTIAGVVYGQAIVAEKLTVEIAFVTRLREHAKVVPNGMMRRLKDLGGELGSRFKPIGRALLLMWRAGPVLVASFALLYVAVTSLEVYLKLGITRAIGPHDITYWTIVLPLATMLPMLLIEPLRIAVVAGAYDATLGRLRVTQQRKVDSGEISEAEAGVRAVAGAAGLMPGTVEAVVASEAGTSGQGSIGNLMKLPSPAGSTSSQNGPSTSSGTTNPTTS